MRMDMLPCPLFGVKTNSGINPATGTKLELMLDISPVISIMY